MDRAGLAEQRRRNRPAFATRPGAHPDACRADGADHPARRGQHADRDLLRRGVGEGRADHQDRRRAGHQRQAGDSVLRRRARQPPEHRRHGDAALRELPAPGAGALTYVRRHARPADRRTGRQAGAGGDRVTGRLARHQGRGGPVGNPAAGVRRRLTGCADRTGAVAADGTRTRARSSRRSGRELAGRPGD